MATMAGGGPTAASACRTTFSILDMFLLIRLIQVASASGHHRQKLNLLQGIVEKGELDCVGLDKYQCYIRSWPSHGPVLLWSPDNQCCLLCNFPQPGSDCDLHHRHSAKVRDTGTGKMVWKDEILRCIALHERDSAGEPAERPHTAHLANRPAAAAARLPCSCPGEPHRRSPQHGCWHAVPVRKLRRLFSLVDHPDIDECLQPDVYPCRGTCVNVPGTYKCSPNKSTRSHPVPGLITVIAISGGFGLLFSLLGVTKISKKLKQQRAKKLRQTFFKRNRGLLLQQLISSNEDIAERTKIFSLEDLEQATNKFDQNRILGGGGHGIVYKGILADQRIVAIKRSKIVVQREIDEFINEVVILSQTNHRNVVKLFGCCLETEVPLLVYEFISNGTLSYHLHGQSESPLPWKDRLRIALETARAIAYLHCAASVSVFHRDIKSTNILLTDTLRAKVSDFGASRSISIDETGIHTAIQGTHGYLDPEYYYTSRLTEKSDVYTFGVILAELLTRVKPVFSTHSSEVKSLASHFVSVIKDNRLLDILDPQIVEEGGAEDAEVVARLAEACLSLKSEERPTMRQVEITLEGVPGSKVHSSSRVSRTIQIVRKDQSHNRNKGNEGTRVYSLEKEFIQSYEIPR